MPLLLVVVFVAETFPPFVVLLTLFGVAVVDVCLMAHVDGAKDEGSHGAGSVYGLDGRLGMVHGLECLG